MINVAINSVLIIFYPQRCELFTQLM